MDMFSQTQGGGFLFAKAQRFGKSFMLPIAVLPAAGILLGIGGALSNPNSVKAYPFLDIGWLQNVFAIMAAAGNIVFANLAILFAIGVAVGLAKSDKGTAGLSAALALLVMNSTINAMLNITGTLAKDNLAGVGQGMALGIQTLETGVFGGVAVGIMTYLLHARFNKTELPQFLGFFGGSRFVPIVTSFSAIFLGMLMFFVWPHFQQLIFGMGGLVESTGYIGTLIYGFVLRMLGPFGLHHIFYLPFWTTALGGAEVIQGQLVEGTQRIFFAQLGDPGTTQYYIGISRFMSGRFITMMFGLLGACLAMYHTSKPEKKKLVGGLLLSAGLTSFLTGITEPIEFSFLFVAPWLYVLHAFFDGCAFMLAHMLEITVGQTFSGGCIDLILFGIFSFKYLILKFNFKTLGREDDEDVPEASGTGTVVGSADAKRSGLIIEGLGGRANIVELDCCATRLRVTVKDGSLVRERLLKESGCRGVLQSGTGVQVIYGPQVTVIKNELEEVLNSYD